MEGSHQKGKSWYRCQYVSLSEFLAERLFGPNAAMKRRPAAFVSKSRSAECP
jgi:hypothetical protein